MVKRKTRNHRCFIRCVDSMAHGYNCPPKCCSTTISEASPPDFFQCLPYQGGAFSLPLLSWLAELDYRRSGEANPIQWDSVLRGRPLRDVDRASGYEIRAWRDWLEHDRYDAYWDEIAFNRQMHRVTIPVFHVSGWYDDVLNGTLINYSALKTTSSTQKLLIGPWPHRLSEHHQ